MPPDDKTPDDEPKTAALSSRSAVAAALLLLGAIVAMTVGMQGCGADDEGAGSVTEGAAAPDFELTSLDGEVIALSDYAGRPVMINFWASWCPPCRDEFPALAAARTVYLDEGFEILGVTRHDTEELSREFADDSGAEWPILPDPDSVAWKAYGAVGLPSSYFVDADGVVQRVHIGPVDEYQIADHLAAIGLSGQGARLSLSSTSGTARPAPSRRPAEAGRR